MLFLFSNKGGALWQGADFMRTKNSNLHPGNSDFYLAKQEAPLHRCLKDLGPNSQFDNVNCKLDNGEAAIIIGHGGSDDRLLDEARDDVTDAAIRLMARIAQDNPKGGYTFFLAACGGAKRQPGASASLLSTLVKRTDAMAQQLLQSSITCWGYTAEAGLVELNRGLPADRIGTHIYGALSDGKGVQQHCGYDSRVTAQLQRFGNGTNVTFIFTPALYPLADVNAWVDGGYKQNMQTRFPELYVTVELTSK